MPSLGTIVDMPYTNWYKGEPNNLKGVEDCMFMRANVNSFYYYDDFKWYDYHCNLPNCFVCQVDLWRACQWNSTWLVLTTITIGLFEIRLHAMLFYYYLMLFYLKFKIEIEIEYFEMNSGFCLSDFENRIKKWYIQICFVEIWRFIAVCSKWDELEINKVRCVKSWECRDGWMSIQKILEKDS